MSCSDSFCTFNYSIQFYLYILYYFNYDPLYSELNKLCKFPSDFQVQGELKRLWHRTRRRSCLKKRHRSTFRNGSELVAQSHRTSRNQFILQSETTVLWDPGKSGVVPGLFGSGFAVDLPDPSSEQTKHGFVLFLPFFSAPNLLCCDVCVDPSHLPVISSAELTNLDLIHLYQHQKIDTLSI